MGKVRKAYLALKGNEGEEREMDLAKVVLIVGAAFLIILCVNSGGDGKMADLLLVNGKIYTVEKNQPWVEAVAIHGGRIVSVGDSESILSLRQDGTRVMDLGGKLVLPGFNDAHVHFSNGGFYLLGIDLRDAKDEAEFTQRIQAYTSKIDDGEWILVGNWDHEAWPSKKHPVKSLIDDVTPNNPVFVQRLDGHIALANSLALEMAGITKDTRDPQGGEIDRDPATGEPTGILKDTAQDLVFQIIPPPTHDQLKKAITTAIKHAHSLGVTSVQDNSSEADFEIYQELHREEELTLRINVWRDFDYYKDFERIGIRPPFGDEYLRLGTIKIFVDGSMGAGTALFYEPYTDDPTTEGLPIYPEKELYEMIKAVDKARLQIAAHAIGDKANTWTLNAFERARKANGKWDSRHRIEHAQVVLPADLPRFKELDIIASVEPSHAIDDMRWAETRIGDRAQYSYRVGGFAKSGTKVALGTDWTVEPLNPMLGLYAAVTREFPEGGPEGGWFPDEKISLEQAIEYYTLGSAYAEFQDHVKGSIKTGKVADLVIIDRNIFDVPSEEILDARVLTTIVGGRIVFQAE